MSPALSAAWASLVAGGAAAVQATLLGILGRRVGVLPATAVGALVGAAVVGAAAVITGRGIGGFVAGFRQPAWLWLLAGLLGAAVVTTLTFAPPRIGTFATFALLVAGQLGVSLLIDAVGLFGVDRVPVSLTRLAGLALLLSGGLLVLRR